MDTDFRALWDVATPYHQFVREADANHDLWTGMQRIARIPDWAVDAVRSTGKAFNFLVIAEDWCGDGTSTIPYLAKLAALSRSIEIRVLPRDQYPEVMDQYRTAGARAIPIVIVLSQGFEEIGHWGPRPAALREWLQQTRATTPQANLYPRIRRWYAQDKGMSTLQEVLALLEQKPSAVSRQRSVTANSLMVVPDG